MGSTVLVAPDIENGQKVLDALEKDRIEVNLLLWAVLEQYGDWRLLVASESFRDDERAEAYSRMSNAIFGLFQFSTPTVTILKLKDPFVTELRGLFGQAGSTFGMRLGGQSFGGKYIEDAFVYQIR